MNWVLLKHWCIHQPTKNIQKKIFMAQKCHFWAKNGHFQDKKPLNQLVHEQYYRISASQITGYCKHTKTNNCWPKNAILRPFLAIFRAFRALSAGYNANFVEKFQISSIHIYIKTLEWLDVKKLNFQNCWFCPSSLYFNWHLVLNV